MPKLLFFAAVAEALTGLALIVASALVGELLLGESLTGMALPVGRVAGIALIALAFACWPGPPRNGMLIYSAAVMAFLAYTGATAATAGILIWPAVLAHLLLTVLFALDAFFDGRWPE